MATYLEQGILDTHHTACTGIVLIVDRIAFSYILRLCQHSRVRKREIRLRSSLRRGIVHVLIVGFYPLSLSRAFLFLTIPFLLDCVVVDNDETPRRGSSRHWATINARGEWHR